MALLFSDNFNRADGAPGSNWVEAGGGSLFSIVSNELTCSTGNNASIAGAVGAFADIADCKVTWKRASGSGYDSGVHVRSNFTGATSNVGSGYIINAFSSQIDIIRRVNNANSLVGSKTGLTLADNDVYAVEITGTGATVSFALTQNSSSLGAAITDTNAGRIVVAGRAGFYCFNAGSMNDDFQIEDVAGTFINAGLDTLAIAEQAAQVRLAKSIAAGVDALVITELAASTNLGAAIGAGVDALTIQEFQALLALQTRGYDIAKMFRYPSPLLRM
jgi:hypothetical protein